MSRLNWITIQLAAPENNPIWTIAHSTNVCPTIFMSSNPLTTILSNYENYQAFDENALQNFGWNPSTPIEDIAEWFNFDFCIAETPDVTSLFVLYPAVNNYEKTRPERLFHCYPSQVYHHHIGFQPKFSKAAHTVISSSPLDCSCMLYDFADNKASYIASLAVVYALVAMLPFSSKAW